MKESDSTTTPNAEEPSLKIMYNEKYEVLLTSNNGSILNLKYPGEEARFYITFLIALFEAIIEDPDLVFSGGISSK